MLDSVHAGEARTAVDGIEIKSIVVSRAHQRPGHQREHEEREEQTEGHLNSLCE